jgi:hypothetical protein
MSIEKSVFIGFGGCTQIYFGCKKFYRKKYKIQSRFVLLLKSECDGDTNLRLLRFRLAGNLNIYKNSGVL